MISAAILPQLPLDPPATTCSNVRGRLWGLYVLVWGMWKHPITYCLVFRVTRHMPGVSSSFPSTSQQTTPSSLRKWPSRPRSTIPTSRRMARLVWISWSVSGGRLGWRLRMVSHLMLVRLRCWCICGGVSAALDSFADVEPWPWSQ